MSLTQPVVSESAVFDGTALLDPSGLNPSEAIVERSSFETGVAANSFPQLTTKSMDAGLLWDKSIDLLKSRLDPQVFSAWIKPLTVANVSYGEYPTERSLLASGDGAVAGETSGESTVRGAEIELIAPNKFCCEHIERHYGDLISAAIAGVTGLGNVILKFRVGSQLENQLRLAASGSKTDGVTAGSRVSSFSTPRISKHRNGTGSNDSNLNPKYNFSNFVVGDCNQFAHAVSLQVSQNLGATYNPLFLYGGVGLGKTHLANAIGNSSRRLGKNVLLVSSEIFVNELISALRANKMQQFKSKFRSLDLLIIDDIQFLIGKERTQEEFFHTFNDLYQRHRQIIVTSDKLPQELIGLDERLRTRFSSGLSADLQAPDFETRVAILLKKSEVEGIALAPEVAELLAQKINSNVRELEGALNRLHALSSLQHSPISVTFAEKALKNFFPEKSREITTDYVQRVVAEHFNVGLIDLSGKRRTQNIAWARHVAMYYCRRLTCLSYPEIGALFGGRDHSTVIHAMKVVEDRISVDSSVRVELEGLEKRIHT